MGDNIDTNIVRRTPSTGNRQLMLRDFDESLLLSSEVIAPKIIGAVRQSGIGPIDFGGFGHAAIQTSLYRIDGAGDRCYALFAKSMSRTTR